MTTEKKAPDYTNSAENLCNPAEVREILLAQRARHKELDYLNEQAQAFIPDDIKDRINALQQEIALEAESLRGYIDTFGSYQDVEAGVYGVKYRRMMKSYHVEPFKLKYPKFVPAVVEETINVKALEGLIKGGLLNAEDLKHPDVGIITEIPQFAFYVR